MIHESACISSLASIGTEVHIWHYSHVDDYACICDHVSIGQAAYIGKNVTVGFGSRVSNCVGVFTGIHISEFVFLGPFMSFTHIKSPRAFVSRKEIFSDTFVGRGVTIGANATILPSLTIEEFSFVGAGSILTKSTVPFSLWVGTPARQVGWVDVYGERLPDLPSGISNHRYVCPLSKDVYEYSPNYCRYHPSGFNNKLITPSESWRRLKFSQISDKSTSTIKP